MDKIDLNKLKISKETLNEIELGSLVGGGVEQPQDVNRIICIENLSCKKGFAQKLDSKPEKISFFVEPF